MTCREIRSVQADEAESRHVWIVPAADVAELVAVLRAAQEADGRLRPVLR